jgi:hypothetical protein
MQFIDIYWIAIFYLTFKCSQGHVFLLKNVYELRTEFKEYEDKMISNTNIIQMISDSGPGTQKFL